MIMTLNTPKGLFRVKYKKPVKVRTLKEYHRLRQKLILRQNGLWNSHSRFVCFFTVLLTKFKTIYLSVWKFENLKKNLVVTDTTLNTDLHSKSYHYTNLVNRNLNYFQHNIPSLPLKPRWVFRSGRLSDL